VAQIEIVYRLHQSNAAHLKQVVHVFAATGKALDNAQHQTKVFLNKGFTRCFVTCAYLLEQFPAAGLVHHGQF